MSARLDAVTLEVLWTRIVSIVDEAAKAIVRTSFSTLSNEANDFACVLTDARGFALAQNSGSIPSFIGTLPATVRHFMAGLGAERMRPGDVLITNDPWQGTGHMSDVCLVKPIFLHGKAGGPPRLVAFSATTAHMPDIGGRIRAIEARELFEEGFHIPLTHLIRAGQVDETLLALLRANVRTPDQTVGDIWAQVSANELMESRVRRLMEEYGLDKLEGLADELFARSERAMREAIAAVPDGTYRFGIETDGFEAPYRGPLFAAGFERRSSIRNNEQWELAARRRLLQGLDTPGVAGDRFRCIFVQSRPVREIQREVRRMVPDLLVLATGHHAAVDRVMRAGIGNDLLRNIECDVLAAPVKLS